MSAEKRQPLDLLDKIYSLGYWMTGSLKRTNELVFRTYQNITSNASEIEVFKTFRDVYFDYASLNEAPPEPSAAGYTDKNLQVIIHQQEADRKLSVLFSEICGLQHRKISIIIDKPLGIVLMWLSSGRKAMIEGLLGILACFDPRLEILKNILCL
ncbi:MAG: RNA polymerase subunit sigma-24 [Chlorobiaceae bacterium]|jgi:hypothetical protein|nr:RNA polymerase subunit sigma-24 [Chlorobiaceae bacterium]